MIGFKGSCINSCHPAEGRGPATRRLPRMSHMPPVGGGQTPPFGGVVRARRGA